jgi:hypothetical protein
VPRRVPRSRYYLGSDLLPSIDLLSLVPPWYSKTCTVIASCHVITARARRRRRRGGRRRGSAGSGRAGLMIEAAAAAMTTDSLVVDCSTIL